MNTYQQVVLNARKQFLKLNKSQEKELLNLYTELAQQLERDISKCRTTSKELYLKKLHNIVVANIRDMHGDLKNIIVSNINSSSEIASSVDYAYYAAITNNTGLLTTFNSMVMNTREQTVRKLIQGQFYKKDKNNKFVTLSQRLWNLENNNIKSIDIAIKTNILRGANAKELAKNIEKYVNPCNRINIKTDAVGFNQNISYNASRLARTSISHSFRETQVQQAMNNPLNIGMKWELSPSHRLRMHGKRDICDEYANQNNYGLGIGVFPAKDLPLGHCNCLCNTFEVNTPINEAVQRLKAWSEGKEDKELDKWYKQNKGITDIKKKEPVVGEKSPKWSERKNINTQYKNKSQIKKHLNEVYNIKFSDSTKNPINKDILQDSINWLDTFHEHFKGFSAVDPVELPIIKIKGSMKSVGYYRYYPNKPQAVELVLNGQYFTDKEYNMKYIEKCIESKWTVANAQSYKTFVHEYGHHIADSLKWLDAGAEKANNNWCKDFINDTIKEYNKKFDKDISFKNISELVSRYGGTTPEETFAETFAEYFGGESPREFAKLFGEKVEKKIRKYIKRG